MITKANQHDVKEIVEAHLHNLKEGVLSSLSACVLGKVYDEFLLDRDSMVFVYREKGKIVGAVAATGDMGKLYGTIKKKHFFLLTFEILKKYALSPFKVARMAFNSGYDCKISAEVVFIFVDSSMRGRQVGQKLMGAVESNFKKRGINEYKISTVGANTTAIRFYEKQNFKKMENFWYMGEERVAYMKSIGRKHG